MEMIWAHFYDRRGIFVQIGFLMDSGEKDIQCMAVKFVEKSNEIIFKYYNVYLRLGDYFRIFV
jgi:hypothetical protein